MRFWYEKESKFSGPVASMHGHLAMLGFRDPDPDAGVRGGLGPNERNAAGVSLLLGEFQDLVPNICREDGRNRVPNL